jgi:hypothetical protein
VTVSGRVSGAGSPVTSLQEQTDAGAFVAVPFDASGAFSFLTALPLDGSTDGQHTVTLRATDQAGDVGTASVSFTLDTSNPAVGSPPLDLTVATTVASSTQFLYTGSDPVQKGVAPGTIDPIRAAVLRGKVLTADGAPLPGVTVTVVAHPEFGSTPTATMSLADGTTRPLSTLHVRATEYTVGPHGDEAMPAQLPANSAYTYAVELSADEAAAAGATGVRFDHPVSFYLEDFLNFPVGEAVPTGYYDAGRGAWVASDNGRVVKVLSVTGGLADLDIDGSGKAATPAALAALGITDAERQQLAVLYKPGQVLWRVPISHFSKWDCNWGFGPPPDAQPPDQPDPTLEPVDQPDTGCGSIIGIQNQSLGEAVPVTGTPFSLHYQSDRESGRAADRTLKISLSGPSVPASLQRIDLEVLVAGRSFTSSFSAAPNQTTTFTWDGKDAYGRTLQGGQPVTVRIGYTYGGVSNGYQRVPRFAYNGNGLLITGVRARQEVILWQELQTSVGAWEARPESLGGWSLDVQHAYDPVGKVLYLGDGTRRSAAALEAGVITTVAGNGTLATPTESPWGRMAASTSRITTAIGSGGSAQTGSSRPWPATALMASAGTAARPPQRNSATPPESP